MIAYVASSIFSPLALYIQLAGLHVAFNKLLPHANVKQFRKTW